VSARCDNAIPNVLSRCPSSVQRNSRRLTDIKIFRAARVPRRPWKGRECHSAVPEATLKRMNNAEIFLLFLVDRHLSAKSVFSQTAFMSTNLMLIWPGTRSWSGSPASAICCIDDLRYCDRDTPERQSHQRNKRGQQKAGLIHKIKTPRERQRIRWQIFPFRSGPHLKMFDHSSPKCRLVQRKLLQVPPS